MNLFYLVLGSMLLLAAGVSAGYYLSAGNAATLSVYDSSNQCSDFYPSGAVLVPFQGKSMLPTIEPGDVVLTKEFDVSKGLVPGEIVGAWNEENGLLVAHRVTSVNGTTFRMKGDNNAGEDAYTYQFSDIRHVVCGDLYR
jgi:hypothetical protein